MNALLYVNIDQGIHKVKLYEMKNEKKTAYMELELVFSF